MKNKSFKINDYKSNRHAVYKLQYHLVVVTKYRHPILNDELSTKLKDIATNVFETNWKCDILEFNTDLDHVHILFEAPPRVQLSKLINNFKTVSSRLLRKQFPDFLSNYYWKPFFWSDTYFISSVSETSEETIREYIQNQKTVSSSSTG